MKRALQVIGCVFALSLLSGCTSLGMLGLMLSHKAEPPDPANLHVEKGDRFITKEATALHAFPMWGKPDLYVGQTHTAERYLEDPVQFEGSDWLFGVVPAGAKLTVTRIDEEYSTVTSGARWYAYGRFDDPKYSDYDVSLGQFMWLNGDSRNVGPNPKFIRAVR